MKGVTLVTAILLFSLSHLTTAFITTATTFRPITARPTTSSYSSRRPSSTREEASSTKEEDELKEVRDYFNTEGFNRWNKIYSDSSEVNGVQMDIRGGHEQTIDKILNWVSSEPDTPGKTFCDCGCGVGSLAIPLASMGATVDASDISSSMAEEASRRASAQNLEGIANFYTSDLESVTGSYDTVCCVDVAIHYPTEQFRGMISHLCSISSNRLIFSFAPKTWYYVALKKFGELFPGPAKATRAYLHEESVVEDELRKQGFKIRRREFTGTNFYFSTLFEAVRE